MDPRHAQILSSHQSHDRDCTHRRNFFLFLDKQALVMQERNRSPGALFLHCVGLQCHRLSRTVHSLSVSLLSVISQDLCGHMYEYFIQ